jgi:hypothetical protein
MRINQFDPALAKVMLLGLLPARCCLVEPIGFERSFKKVMVSPSSLDAKEAGSRC